MFWIDCCQSSLLLDCYNEAVEWILVLVPQSRDRAIDKSGFLSSAVFCIIGFQQIL